MRIVMVSSDFLPNIGGAAHVFRLSPGIRQLRQHMPVLRLTHHPECPRGRRNVVGRATK